MRMLCKCEKKNKLIGGFYSFLHHNIQITGQMNNQEVDRLILKLINNTLSEIDSDKLVKWLVEPENLNYFNEYIKVNQLINSTKKFDHRYSLKQFVEKSQRKSRFKNRTWYIAAILVVALFVGNFVFDGFFNNSNVQLTPVIVNNNIKPGENKAILTLENGEEISFIKGSSLKTANAISNGEDIVYTINSNVSELVYNTLTIPRGGQFKLQLSDGTKVWLNSETKLKYPVSFIKGQTREVELVYGEAYFEASPSINHKGSGFKVHKNQHVIEVIGTKFNLKAYPDDLDIQTTLVEGKVSISHNETQSVLLPNDQSTVNLKNKFITIKQVNVQNVISWKEGVFNFEDKSLKDIMKVLSRWYDMDVEFENKSLEDVKFIGVLRKNESIEEILDIIMSSSINNYEINNKKVIIK